MANEVRTGEGTTLSVGAAVASVLNIKPPGWSRAAVAKTTLSDAFKKYRPGRITEYGTMTARIQHTSENEAAFLAFATDVDPKDCTIAYFDEAGDPDGTDTFKGFVTAYEPDQAEDENNIEADVTIQLTTVITHTPPA